MKTSSYRESLLGSLKDPQESAAYLNAALEDSPEAFLKAMKNVAQSQPETELMHGSGAQRETFDRSLADGGNPTLTTLSSLLAGLGLRLSVETVAPHSTR